MSIFTVNFFSYFEMAEPYDRAVYDPCVTSHFQYLHISYLENVMRHFKFNYDLYLAEKEIHPNLKFYEYEDQPMYLVPLFNAAERLKALEPFFVELHIDFPGDIVFGPDFPKFNFPDCWIKEKTEEVIRHGKAVQFNYKYVWF